MEAAINAFSESFGRLVSSIEYHARGVEPSGWMLIALAVVGLWAFFYIRAPR
jgi:hypothetical protein